MTPHFHLISPMKATRLTTAANQSTVFPLGKRALQAEPDREVQDHANDRRGIAESAVASLTLPRNCSM